MELKVCATTFQTFLSEMLGAVDLILITAPFALITLTRVTRCIDRGLALSARSMIIDDS